MRAIFSVLIIAAACSLAGCVTAANDADTRFMKDRYDWNVPHGKVFIETSPQGALLEIYQDEEWMVVGSTPCEKPIMLEATQKPHLIRVTKPGYYPEVHRVVLPGATRDTHINIPLRVDRLAKAENLVRK